MQNYYLKFFLKGKQEPFIYQITKQTAKRVQEFLSNNQLVEDTAQCSIKNRPLMTRIIRLHTSIILPFLLSHNPHHRVLQVQ
jgi:hypothetical protein